MDIGIRDDMKSSVAVLPPFLVLDQLLQGWLLEDIGRGDRTTQSLLSENPTDKEAKWIEIGRAHV